MLIDLSNYDSTLIQSTQGRTGTPDGNVFFNKTNGEIEFISASELATLDLTSIGGGAADPNPLLETDGIKFEAIYAFENQERSSDESLRQYDRWTSGTFKFGGAYNFINGRVPSTDGDRSIIRGSGWNEYGVDGVVDKIYFGNKGLSNINPGSQPYYQLGIFSTAVNYAKPGQIDEAVLVGGTEATDNTNNPEIVSVRTYGNTYDRKSTSTDLGIAELGGYSTGFAVNEGPHLTTNVSNAHPFVDVWTTPAGAWENMTLEKLATPLVKDEFAEAQGSFSWVINNPDGSTLDEVVAYLDAIATVTTDIDSGSETVTIGKDVDVWYSYNASGQVVTNSGADSLGLYITNIPVADQQRVVFTDDAGNEKTYLFLVGVEANVGAIAKADTNAWYHSYFQSDYNSASATVVLDSAGNEVKGNASSADAGNLIKYTFDYDGDTEGGSAGTNKNAFFLCEGDGGATQAKTLYTLNRTTTVAFTCAPGVENNV